MGRHRGATLDAPNSILSRCIHASALGPDCERSASSALSHLHAGDPHCSSPLNAEFFLLLFTAPFIVSIMGYGVIVFFTALVAIAAAAAPLSTVAVPNGNNVVVNGHWWPALFNSTWRGSSLSQLNPFGVAFLGAAEAWTAALCNADTDGDGFTNGEELGDPNCQWTASGKALPNRTLDISHPGLWSSVPSSATYPAREQAAFPGVCSRPVTPAISTDQERVLLRSTVAVPASWDGVTRTAELVKVLTPGPDTIPLNDLGFTCPWDQPGLKNWHDAAVWPSGVVPQAGSNVTLPPDVKLVVWSCSVPSRGYAIVTIPPTSELIIADDAVHLRVKDILVYGRMRVGSPACPVHSPVTITFSGTRSELPVYSNGLRVMDRGVLEMHGPTNEFTWTRLRTTAFAGTTVIVLQDAVQWSVYEDIVIITSIWKDEVENQNEVRRIAAADATNRSVIVLDRPLNFKHYGGPEYQSEVALLWRPILLRGDTAGYSESFGGHTMAIGALAQYRLAGVRADRMGQLNTMARYPFHMHMMYAAGASSYFQQLSCTSSYYRCYTVHGTNHTLVRKNVAFDSNGHTFYLEDGCEMNNTLEFNLAAYIHPIGKPASGGAQSGEEFTESVAALLPADHTAAGFYIPNPGNRLRGNAASGGWAGFSFPVFDTCLKLSSHLPTIPKVQPMLEFDANSAHSSGYYWGDAGCVYHGGRLWPLSDGTLKYSSGRYSQPTQGIHNVTNLRTWLCQSGLASWGETVDMTTFECHDCTRSAVLFGRSSLRYLLMTANTANMPKDMFDSDSVREGFQFYDTWVQTQLINATFRNFWKRPHLESTWYRTGIIKDLTHSDKFKPWGISATKNIRFDNVGRDIILSRFVRESGASRMFNFVDWDGSMVNSATCQGYIVGSDIPWWNLANGECTYQTEWRTWICPRKPGREVVGIDMNLPGLSDDLDYQPSTSTLLLDPALRDDLYIGHMSHFGADGSNRRLILTKNHHLATGLSGIGWYMYLFTGVPALIEIKPQNMPRGTYVLLAISYPAGTTFVIRSQNKWGTAKPLRHKQVADRDAVLASNGTTYTFDGRHLYLKLSDMYSQYPNAYVRDNVSIYSVMPTHGGIYVNAS